MNSYWPVSRCDRAPDEDRPKSSLLHWNQAYAFNPSIWSEKSVTWLFMVISTVYRRWPLGRCTPVSDGIATISRAISEKSSTNQKVTGLANRRADPSINLRTQLRKVSKTANWLQRYEFQVGIFNCAESNHLQHLFSFIYHTSQGAW